MAKQNRQDTNADLLLANGYREVTAQARTSRYRVFTAPDGKRNVYLGKAGSVRSGATATDSHPSTICERLREV